MMHALGWQDRVCDLDGHEQRCRPRQFQLPTEQDTRRDSLAARYLRQAGSRPRRLLDDPAFSRQGLPFIQLGAAKSLLLQMRI
jgi:hypothetical protein